MFFYTVYEYDKNDKGETTFSQRYFKELTFKNYKPSDFEKNEQSNHRYEIRPTDGMNEYYNACGLHLMYNVLGSCDAMSKFRPLIYNGYGKYNHDYNLIKIALILKNENKITYWIPWESPRYSAEKIDIVYSDGYLTDGIKHYGAVMTDFMRTLIKSTDKSELSDNEDKNENNKDYSNVTMLI